MIKQNYLQCRFFDLLDKDKEMHGTKPPSGRRYRIGEAARALSLQTCVLRFWESEFPELRPVRTPKGQRLYTERDMTLLRKIRSLLHEQGMTIEGARRVLSGAAPAPAENVEKLPSNDSGGVPPQLLHDVLDELRQIRAMLTASSLKENKS